MVPTLPFLFDGSVSMSQKSVVPTRAADAVEMNREMKAEVVFCSVVRAAISWRTSPGTASNTNSPPLQYTISVSGSMGAPCAGSAPLATLYASMPARSRLVMRGRVAEEMDVPGFTNVMIDMNSKS
jgi:hypothetical protein